jgi:hypothetical protein
MKKILFLLLLPLFAFGESLNDLKTVLAKKDYAAFQANEKEENRIKSVNYSQKILKYMMGFMVFLGILAPVALFYKKRTADS